MSQEDDSGRQIVVADAGPLIALGRIGRLALLRQLYDHVTVPPRVYSELHLRESRPGSRALRRAVAAGWLEAVAPEPDRDLEQLLLTVDPGEAEAIILAARADVRFLLMEEHRGRQLARRRGIAVVGTGGVLLAAKRRGLVESLVPILAELDRAGYRFSSRLRQEILELAGEADP